MRGSMELRFRGSQTRVIGGLAEYTYFIPYLFFILHGKYLTDGMGMAGEDETDRPLLLGIYGGCGGRKYVLVGMETRSTFGQKRMVDGWMEADKLPDGQTDGQETNMNAHEHFTLYSQRVGSFHG